MSSDLTCLGTRRVAIVVFAVALIGLFVNDPVFSQKSPAGTTQPTAALKDGWDAIDQRMVFLTVQLSTVESSIEATNKALKVNGYQQAVRQEAADRARAGNERMDRNGGGPVSWQDFYGKTAQRFFYHPADDNTGYINPVPIAQRPPQFNYIYRANEQNRAKAESDVAHIGTKIDDLLKYRRQLEAQQSALWGQIAFRGTSSLDIASRPIYRMDFATAGSDDASKQCIEAAKAGAAFLTAINSELTDAQRNLDVDERGVLDHLVQTTASARGLLQAKLLQLPALATSLSTPRSSIGQLSRAANRLEDSAQNIVDAYRLAADCDSNDDTTGKQIYRGQLQQMFLDYASTVATADQSLTAAVAEWKLTMIIASKPSAAVPPPTTMASANDIPGRLDDAKIAHQKEMASARRGLISVIDTRLNAAADAGDLTLAQSLQAAKLNAAADGTIPDSVTDPAILAANKQMAQSIQAADGRLSAAYHEAIVGYTKARKFTEAEAVQDELASLGLASTTDTAIDTGQGTPDSKPIVVKVSSTDPNWQQFDTLSKGRYRFEIIGKINLHDDEPAFIVGSAGREFSGHWIGSLSIKLGDKIYDTHDAGIDIENGRAVAVEVTTDTQLLMRVNDLSYGDNRGSYTVSIYKLDNSGPIGALSRADILHMLRANRTWYWHWENHDKDRPFKFVVDSDGHIGTTDEPNTRDILEERWILLHNGHCLIPTDMQTFHGFFLDGGRQAGAFTEKRITASDSRSQNDADGLSHADVLRMLRADRTWYFHWEQYDKNHPFKFVVGNDSSIYGTDAPDQKDSLEQRWIIIHNGHFLVPINTETLEGFFLETGRQTGAFTEERLPNNSADARPKPGN